MVILKDVEPLVNVIKRTIEQVPMMPAYHGFERLTVLEIQHAMLKALDELPGVEVQCGYWEAENNRPRSNKWLCSECGEVAVCTNKGGKNMPKKCWYRYCPNCGALMSEGGSDNG